MTQNIQTFIETYYPNYHKCETITRMNDLQVVIDTEVIEDSYAEKVKEEIKSSLLEGRLQGWCGDEDELEEEVMIEAQIQLDLILKEVYEVAIDFFMKQNKITYYLAGHEACLVLDTYGADHLSNIIKNGEFTEPFSIIKHNPLTDSHMNFADALDGYERVEALTEEMYTILTNACR